MIKNIMIFSKINEQLDKFYNRVNKTDNKMGNKIAQYCHL